MGARVRVFADAFEYANMGDRQPELPLRYCGAQAGLVDMHQTVQSVAEMTARHFGSGRFWDRL